MHLDHLRAFVVLAEELNFRQAARRLQLSQPGLSAQIRSLERALGTRLFERDRAGTRLSARGRDVLPLAATATNAVRDVLDAAGGRTSAGVRRRRLVVGLFIDGVGELTWPILQGFRVARPDVDVVLRTVNFSETFTAVRTGAVDVALLRGPVSTDGVDVVSLARCPVAVAVAAGHPLADADHLQLIDVVGHLAYEVPRGLDPTMRDFWLQSELHDVAQPRLRLRSKDRAYVDDCAHDVARAGTVSLFPVGSPISYGPECVVRPLMSDLFAPVLAVSRPMDADARAFVEVAQAVSAQLLPLCRHLVPQT